MKQLVVWALVAIIFVAAAVLVTQKIFEGRVIDSSTPPPTASGVFMMMLGIIFAAIGAFFMDSTPAFYVSTMVGGSSFAGTGLLMSIHGRLPDVIICAFFFLMLSIVGWFGVWRYLQQRGLSVLGLLIPIFEATALFVILNFGQAVLK